MTDRPSYLAVLRTRHLVRSFVPSILGRMSLAISGLALVLLLESVTGSFAVAGAATAVLGATSVAATPWRARLVDRFGQLRVVASLALAHAGALLALGLAAAAPLPAVLGLAAVAGAALPPFATSMRVLWSVALPDGGMRTRGLSLDAVAGEATYAIGPLVAATIASLAGPFAAVVTAAALVAVGALLFVASPLSRSQRGADRRRDPSIRTPLRTRGFPSLIVVMIAPGVVLGAVEIAGPAIATDASSTTLAGILLALVAGSSGLSGLAFGMLRPRRRVGVQLVLLASALLAIAAAAGVGTALLGVAAAVAGFVALGAALAPVLIVGYLATDAHAEEGARTEANGWMDAAVNLGAALGAALVGALVTELGAGFALSVGAGAALVAVVVGAPALLRRR